MSKKKNSIFTKAQKQLDEDRTKLLDLFKDLNDKTDSKEDYALNGQSLAKFAELLIKNTAQVVDLVKATYKPERFDGVLSEEEVEKTYEAIEEEEEPEAEALLAEEEQKDVLRKC